MADDFDDDFDDSLSVAYAPASASSIEPDTGTFIQKWKYGRVTGSNNVPVSELSIDVITNNGSNND